MANRPNYELEFSSYVESCHEVINNVNEDLRFRLIE